LIFVSPCQSEIKRTLRLGGRPPNTAHSRQFRASRGIHSTRMVNVWFPAALDLWFRNGGRATRDRLASSIKNLRRIESFEFAGKFPGLYLNANI
jgi:hypothetical protein